MDTADPRTPAERFAGILAWLNRALAAAAVRNTAAAPLILLLWPRLNRLAARFGRLAARVAAGTATPRRRTAARPASARPRRPDQRLPRRFGWLLPVAREAAAAAGSQLQHLLSDPGMAEILAAAPQAGRLLRPLCRMLGVRPPPILTPPPRPAPPPRPTARRVAVRPTAAAPPDRPAQSAPPVPPTACGPPVAA